MDIRNGHAPWHDRHSITVTQRNRVRVQGWADNELGPAKDRGTRRFRVKGCAHPDNRVLRRILRCARVALRQLLDRAQRERHGHRNFDDFNSSGNGLIRHFDDFFWRFTAQNGNNTLICNLLKQLKFFHK
ncbi:hypothetical protein D3C85_1430370 [compost metagenome]